MRFLILNVDYPDFLQWLYAEQSGLKRRSYKEQMQARNESLFGVADFYSSNLCKLGHEARDIHVNNEVMQKAWAREHGITIHEPGLVVQRTGTTLQRARRKLARTPVRYLKLFLRSFLRSLDLYQSWVYDILAAQIRHYKPDVVLNQAMDVISSCFLVEMKPFIRLMVGQIAAPLPQNADFSCYDLVISSLPNYVELFRQMGIQSELQRLAFEPRILDKLNRLAGQTAVSFVGGLSSVHKNRVDLLEYLCERVDIDVWGPGAESLPSGSLIRRRYHGEAWGIDMYRILHNSRISLNQHIGIAESYANNCRLFEATGVGTLLITDWKVNLHEMFEPGKEVVAYRTPEECVELIQYYLEHDDEREAIARAGQQRTLKEHTYYNRMQELVDLVSKYL